jgi:hypothetical protein
MPRVDVRLHSLVFEVQLTRFIEAAAVLPQGKSVDENYQSGKHQQRVAVHGEIVQEAKADRR